METKTLLEADDDVADDGVWPPWKGSSFQFVLEVVLLASGMGIIIGCAVSLISLAPVLNPAGSINPTLSSGTLYGAFTLTCIPAPFVVKLVGPKWGLALGATLYVAYAVGNRFQQYTSLLLVSAVLGGIGSTILWTSQGAYITTISYAHDVRKGKGKGSSLGMFNGIFVALFQTGLVTCQLLSSFLLRVNPDDDGSPNANIVTVLYDVYVILAAVGAFLLFLLPVHTPLFSKRTIFSDVSLFEKLSATVILLVTNPLMPLMIPSNMAFGFEQGFQNGVWYADIVKRALGAQNNGFISSISSGIGAIFGYPLGMMADRVGFAPLMVVGFVAHSSAFVTLLITHNSYDPYDTSDGLWLSGWGPIVTIAFLFGVGNAVWNSMNSAVFGLYFSDNKEAAFANLKFWSGLSTALMLLVFNHHCNPKHKPDCDLYSSIASPVEQIIIVLLTLVVGIIGYFASVFFYKRRTYEKYDEYVINNE